MSIIDDEIETQRKEAPPYRFIDPQTIFEDGYWDGATRNPTDEEIVAGAKSVLRGVEARLLPSMGF